MKISKEVRLGIASVFALGILFWGYNYLKGTNIFFKNTSVYAVYPKVSGLSVSAPIIINGVQSGVVDAIYFHPNKSSSVIVRLSISETALFIPRNSIAELISVDFMGSKAIGLKLGDSKVVLAPGDTLMVDYEPSMLEGFSKQMMPIKERAVGMMDSLKVAIAGFNELTANLNEVLNNRNKRNLSSAISNLNKTILSYDALAKSLNSSINNSVNPAMETYKKLGEDLIAADIKGTIEKAKLAFENMSLIMENINKGKGTMGKLMTNDSLYNNMNNASKEMEELLEDMKLHPKRYFRILSRKEIPYKEN